VNWEIIDGKKDKNHLRGFGSLLSPDSYAVVNSVDCRFIRLVQLGEEGSNDPDDTLAMEVFEVFGTFLK
jgi:hypothetical protein